MATKKSLRWLIAIYPYKLLLAFLIIIYTKIIYKF
jgi:hypothetical protein